MDPATGADASAADKVAALFKAARRRNGVGRLRLAFSASLAAALVTGASAAEPSGGWSQPRSARPEVTRPMATPAATSSRLKWRASTAVSRPAASERVAERTAERSVPRRTAQTQTAAPKQASREPAFRRSRPLTEPGRLARSDAASPLTDNWEEAGDIILTRAPAEPNPLDDPFEDESVAAPRASQLKLFSTAIEADAFSQDDDISPPPDYDGDSPRPTLRRQRRPRSSNGPLTMDDDVVAQSPDNGLDRCPTPADLIPISKITDHVAADPVGGFPPECPLSTESFPDRNFMQTTYTWKASALCHKPLYFEAVPLERYGHSWGPILQPFVSGAHFFVSVPLLPYKMGLEAPWECIYPLGYYRPGSCAPYTLGPIPFSLRGAALQGAAVTGAFYAFP